MPTLSKAFLLPLIPALRYLERLERAEFAPFTQSLHDDALSDLKLKFSVAWGNFSGKV